MPTKTIVIDGDDKQHFFLSLDGSTLTVGDGPAHAESLFQNLHVSRIRCEIEVEDETVAVTELNGQTGNAPFELKPGVAVAVGHSHFHLELPVAPPPAPAPTPDFVPDAPAIPATPAAPAGPALRLKVIDGADQGRSFPMPTAGTLTLGKNSRFADIVLHDLYVARVHCELLVEDGQVIVTHIEGAGGTRVDGANVVEPTVLKQGGILRIGNSHLRLELGPVGELPEVSEGPKSGYMAKAATAAPKSGYMSKLDEPPASGYIPKSTLPNVGSSANHKIDPLTALGGQVFGHYRIGPILGRGFCGAVYQAHDTKDEHVVALKVLAPEFPAAQAELDKFAKALTAAAHIPHPNLVALHGGGRSGVHCWIAREYVEGESAAAVVGRVADGEKVSWARACRVAAHLARALEAVHGSGRIHGNITPRNVLLKHEDHSAKLSDLLFTQAVEGSKLRESMAEKKRAMEVGYIAAEQTEAGAFVDRLADLYAVGAVTYALLTGRAPHIGPTPKDVEASIRSGRVPKPTAYHKKVPATFEAVVLKLLAKRQEDRYQTATGLLEDLTAIAEDHGLTV